MSARADTASISAPFTLQLQGLNCTLGSRPILREFTIQPLASGQIVAIVGRNGAGKSTLLRSIAGLLPCEAHTLQLGDIDLRRLKAAGRSAALRYLPQAAPGLLHLSVHDCLQVALRAQGHRLPAGAQEHLATTAADLGLSELLAHPVDELSGGQKQRVWLAQALIHRPHILLLDEPLAALDPHHQHHVMRLLRRLTQERTLLVLVVLHDLNMALRYADQILVLHEGRAIAQGPASSALTAETLAQAFQIRARLENCSLGIPHIIVDDLLTF